MIPLNMISGIAAAKGESSAIIFDNSSVSWSDYHSIVKRLVDNIIYQYKDRSFDSICFISPNREELIFLSSAFATLKIPFLGLDYSLDTNSLQGIVNRTSCDLLVISSVYCKQAGIDVDHVAGNIEILDLDNTHETATTYQTLKALKAPVNTVDSSIRPFVGISFTSGTSGTPKTVLRHQSFDSRRFSYFTTRYGFNANDNHLLCIPIYHAAGSGWARLFLQLGATLVIAPFEDPSMTLRVLKNEWITTTVMTPPMLGAMLQEADKHKVDLSQNQLKFLLVGGKNFPTNLKKRSLQLLGPVVYEYYGTTETGVNTIAEPNDLIDKLASVGRVFDGNDIKIVDNNYSVLAKGKIGRIAVSSYMNMDGYADTQCEKVVYDKKDYLITPETGFIDEDGYLYLMNRSDGSVSHDLFSIENDILGLPCVQDVSLIPGDSDSPMCDCAIVVRKNSIDNIDIVCKKVFDLAMDKGVLVRSVSVVNELPYTPTGKVRYSRLKDTLENKAIARVDCEQDSGLENTALNVASPEIIPLPFDQAIPDDTLNKIVSVEKASFINKAVGKKAVEETASARSENKAMSSLTKFVVGVLCLVGTTLSWGAMFPIAKNALSTLDAVHISLVRYGLASIILLSILAFSEGFRSLLPGKDVLKLWFFGSLGFAGFSILAFAGLAHTKAQHGAIIMAMMPLLSVLALWLLQGKRPALPIFGFIAMAFCGVVMVVTQGDLSSLQGGALLPSLVILLGATCWVVYTLGSSYVKNFSVLRYTALSAGLGSLTIVGIATTTNSLGITTLPDTATLLGIKWELTFLVLIAGVMAVFSWNFGIKALGPVNGVLFINLVPITAFSIEYLRGAQITHTEITGAITTIGALILCNLYSRGWFKSLHGVSWKPKFS